MTGYNPREGKIIGGKRMCGKTTRLIEKAHKEQLYILCANKEMAKSILKQARDMGKIIPHPVSPNNINMNGLHMDEILVDEAEMVIQALVGKQVVGMSSTMKLEELEPIDEQEKDNQMTIEIDVDTSNAIKGLKSIQREAKKATAALKELGEYSSQFNN